MSTPRVRNVSAKAPRIMERHIEEAVCALLEIDGWRSWKMEENFSERKMKRTGERGMPDRLFLRYHHANNGCAKYEWVRACGEILWIEFKAPGKLPRPEQAAWHDAERARGALVLVVDDFDKFKKWYMAGLNLRIKK